MRALPFRRALAPLCLALFVSVIATAPLSAQLGALRRAAERRVGQKAEDQANVARLVEPTFDETTVEITAERLDRFQAAMERRRDQQAQNRAAYEALNQRADATRDSAEKAGNDRERTAYESATTRYRECRYDVEKSITAAQERKSQELAARMQANPMAAQNDPKMKEIVGIMQQMAAAQQRGDAAATEALTQKFAAAMGGATDSVSLDRAAATKCGARPVRPASMVRSEQLKQRADSLGKSARDMLASASRVKGSEVGMSDRAAAMFWERIASWLVGMRDDAPITKTFSKAEYELLVARRGALRKAFSGSE